MSHDLGRLSETAMNLLRPVPPEEAKTQAAAVSRADHPQVSAPEMSDRGSPRGAR